MAYKIFFSCIRIINLDFKYRLIIDYLLVMLNMDGCYGMLRDEGYAQFIQ